MAQESLPWELRLTLRTGTVYYFVHRETTSAEPHFFVILNHDPRKDTLLLMTIVSSQIETVCRRRKHLPPETLVQIAATEYQPFSKESIVDCNRVFELGRGELIAKHQSGAIRNHEDLPEPILSRIIAGILASPLVSEDQKKLIRGNTPGT